MSPFLTKNRLLPWLGLLLLIAAPIVVQSLGLPALLGLITRIAIAALAAASLNVLLGYGGLVSFGHAAYYGLGAYTVGILNAQFVSGDPLFGFIPGTNELLITLPAAMLVSGLVAVGLGALCLRTAGVQFIMITLAFAQMIYFLFISLKAYGGDDGLLIRRPNIAPFLNLRDGATMYYLAAFCLIAYVLFCGRLMRSRFGRVIAGQRQSDRRMAALGVSTYPYKLLAFVLAGMGAGLAGALTANYARFVSPDLMHWTHSGDLLIMVVIGGAGRLWGPLLGAAVLIGLETVLAGWTQYWQIIMGPILVLVALYSPQIHRRLGLVP
jgi:branched-chain amino acid transport system permease protein